MSIHRILIASDARPARTWRIAQRIAREVPGAEICGILQRPLERLPLVEQLIAAGRTAISSAHQFPFPSVRLRLRAALERLVDCALWVIHGSPDHKVPSRFTFEMLAEKCGTIGCPVLLAEDFSGSSALRFIKQHEPELAVLLGELTPGAELLEIPERGWVRARQSATHAEANGSRNGIAITIESLASKLQRALTICRFSLPVQPYDGLAGLRLKADLVSDDLAVQSVTQLIDKDPATAGNAVAAWVEEILSPYVKQLQAPQPIDAQNLPGSARHRAIWKLGLDTLLLCSPLIVARNWYRRLRGRYPVTILTHHLVSDRPHRMGISTELFWRHVHFLKRHYRIVSLSEAAALLKSGRVEVPTAVVTFDDGYADNFVSLRAVAEEAEIPVALFITTQPVELRQEFQHDLDNGVAGVFPLTWPQIRYWSLGNVEFGSHTRTHFDCGSSARSKLHWEIVGSKWDLEQCLGRLVEVFAFPFGQKENISSEALELASASHRYFVSAFGGENQCDGRGGQHLLRKGFYGNRWELELDLQSVFDLVDRAKQRLHLRQLKSPSLPIRSSAMFPSAVAGGVETQVNTSS